MRRIVIMGAGGRDFHDFNVLWQHANQRRINRATPAKLRRQSWPAGSIGPKIEAACRFVDHGGRTARIGSLDDVGGLVAGTSGTIVEST